MRDILTVEFLRPAFLLFGLLAIPTFFMLVREGRFGRYFRTASGSAAGASTTPAAIVRALAGAMLVATLAAVSADPRYPIVRKTEKRQ